MNLPVIHRSTIFAALLVLARSSLFAQQQQQQGSAFSALPAAPLPPPAAAAQTEAQLFVFPGGTPAEFLKAVDKMFGVDWSQIATIPEAARDVRIPPMRMRVASPEEVFKITARALPQTPEQGKWGMLTGPERIGRNGSERPASAVWYEMPPPSTSLMEVRAISLRDVPSDKWDALLRLLDESLNQVLPVSAQGGAATAPVKIKIHREAAMLMITATKEHIEKVEALATTLRTGMAKAAGEANGTAAAAAGGLAPSKLVPLAGPAANDAKTLEGVLQIATKVWTQAQQEQGAKADGKVHFTYFPDLHGVLLVGPREWIEFAEQVAGEWAARRTDNTAAMLADGFKVRAFSIAGMPPETVGRIVDQMQMTSTKLRKMQEIFAEETGLRSAAAGALINDQPRALEQLQVLLVTGNDAGLEFARSLIEEAKVGADKMAAGEIEAVLVDGAVRAPQRLVWTKDLTVLGAISACGGLMESAKDTIRLIRRAETITLSRKQMAADPKKDEKLEPGDQLKASE